MKINKIYLVLFVIGVFIFLVIVINRGNNLNNNIVQEKIYPPEQYQDNLKISLNTFISNIDKFGELNNSNKENYLSEIINFNNHVLKFEVLEDQKEYHQNLILSLNKLIVQVENNDVKYKEELAFIENILKSLPEHIK